LSDLQPLGANIAACERIGVTSAFAVGSLSHTEGVMLFVAGALAVLSGLFYAAQHHEIGSFGVTMCQYGSTFCDNPSWVFVGAVLAALWGTFVSIR